MSDHKYDDYNYALIYKTDFAERKIRGFTGGLYSTDDNWVMGSKGDKETFDWVNFDINLLPDYMKKLGITKACLSYQQVMDIKNCIASEKGASDGYTCLENV